MSGAGRACNNPTATQHNALSRTVCERLARRARWHRHKVGETARGHSQRGQTEGDAYVAADGLQRLLGK